MSRGHPAGPRRHVHVHGAVAGHFLVVDAKQTDGSGTVELSTQQALIPTQALRDFVAQNASLPATIDCGPSPFTVARAGQVLTCGAALADGTTRQVDLTVAELPATSR